MKLSGRVFSNTGAAKVGLAVTVYDLSDNSTEGSDTTDSNGEWEVASLDDDKQYYIEIVDGSNQYNILGNINVQVENICADISHSRTATELTLSSAGAITITQDFHLVDTYGGAASGEIVTINGGYSNQILTVWAASSSRDVVIPVNAAPAANGIYNNTAPFTMNITQDRAQLLFDDTLGYWILLNPRNVG